MPELHQISIAAMKQWRDRQHPPNRRVEGCWQPAVCAPNSVANQSPSKIGKRRETFIIGVFPERCCFVGLVAGRERMMLRISAAISR